VNRAYCEFSASRPLKKPAGDVGGLSVLMACHGGDEPARLEKAFESLARQTLPADEIVLVQDGPIGSGLSDTLRAWHIHLPLRHLVLDANRGLGYALQYALPECRFALVARVDADDISVPDRFERQVSFLNAYPEISAVGSWIVEFGTDAKGLTFELPRALPTFAEEVKSLARTRSPLNHMSVMLRRDDILAAGNYEDLVVAQDYQLWGRLLAGGYRIANIPEYLVYAHVGKGPSAKRGGWRRLVADLRVQRDFVRAGFLTPVDLLVNVPARILLRLTPMVLRQWVYKFAWRPERFT